MGWTDDILKEYEKDKYIYDDDFPRAVLNIVDWGNVIDENAIADIIRLAYEQGKKDTVKEALRVLQEAECKAFDAQGSYIDNAYIVDLAMRDWVVEQSKATKRES